MSTIKKVKAHQKKFLEKAKSRKKPLVFTIEGRQIIVNPGVFPPATDTKLLASNVQVSKGDHIIDMTTGSGIIPVIAGLQGASGYAVDINPQAVENARQNVKKYKVDINVIESDLFSNVPIDKFDAVFANGPFFEGEIIDPMDYACYGARDFIENLFKGIVEHLKPKGKLLIVVSEWAELDHLEKTAVKNGLLAKVIDKRKSDDGKRGYLLYEISLKQ